MRIEIRGDSFEIDPQKLTFGEAARIESATGLTFSKWGEQLQAGSVTALRALVWTLMRRTQPELRIDDVDGVEFGEVQMVADKPQKPAGKAARAVDPTPKAS